MFKPGDRIRAKSDGALGAVISNDAGNVKVIFDKDAPFVWEGDVDLLAPADPAPAPSVPADSVYADLLRHARIEGRAIGALMVIRDEAALPLSPGGYSRGVIAEDALRFILSYVNDVLDRIKSE